MRVSAVRGAPDYARNAQVLLDGRAMPFAVAADDVEGWVDVLHLEVLGDREAMLSSYWRGDYPVRQLRGHVEIREAP